MNEKTMTVEDDLHFEQMIAEESVCTKENLVYERPETLTDATMHYCPGCGHGVRFGSRRPRKQSSPPTSS